MYQLNGMRYKLIYLCFGLIGLLSCSEPPSATSSEDPLQTIEETAVSERPEEIEVFDLTEEVPLYLVIAGSYSSETGAQKKVEALKQAGFDNADIIQRSDSKLYSVFVERFDSEATAEGFVKQIATDYQIKSYVYEMDE